MNNDPYRRRNVVCEKCGWTGRKKPIFLYFLPQFGPCPKCRAYVVDKTKKEIGA